VNIEPGQAGSRTSPAPIVLKKPGAFDYKPIKAVRGYERVVPAPARRMRVNLYRSIPPAIGVTPACARSRRLLRL
jgi:hypothetical protein